MVEILVDPALAAMTAEVKDPSYLVLFVTSVVRTVKFLSDQMVVSQFIAVLVLRLRVATVAKIVAVIVVASETTEAMTDLLLVGLEAVIAEMIVPQFEDLRVMASQLTLLQKS